MLSVPIKVTPSGCERLDDDEVTRLCALLTEESRNTNPFPILKKEWLQHDEFQNTFVEKQIYEIGRVPNQCDAWKYLQEDKLKNEEKNTLETQAVSYDESILAETRRMMHAAWDEASDRYVDEEKPYVEQGFKALALRLHERLSASFLHYNSSVYIFHGTDSGNPRYLFHKEAGQEFSFRDILTSIEKGFGCWKILHVYTFPRLLRECAVIACNGKWLSVSEDHFSKTHLDNMEKSGLKGAILGEKFHESFLFYYTGD